jgi:cytochrome b subunit of formate dehydrogenase
MLDAHYTLQKALRWWLYLHVPASLMLVLLVGLHVYAVIYY